MDLLCGCGWGWWLLPIGREDLGVKFMHWSAPLEKHVGNAALERTLQKAIKATSGAMTGNLISREVISPAGKIQNV